MNEIREDMLKVKRMVSEVEMILGKREGETELVNKLIDAENLLTYCMSRLENAIVPPCKVGQTVYTRYGYSFKIQRIEVLEDKKILFRCGNDGTDDYMAFYDFEIGTDVFLTREEAEKALSERRDSQ